MAESHACESSQENVDNNEVLNDNTDYLITCLAYNHSKSVFKWLGNFEELKLFCAKHLEIDLTTCSVNHNERSKSLKSNSSTIVLFNTGTLQLQGGSAQTVKVKLHSILESNSNTGNQKNQDDRDLKEDSQSDSDESDSDDDDDLDRVKAELKNLKSEISFIKNIITANQERDASKNDPINQENQSLKVKNETLLKENEHLRYIITMHKDEISKLQKDNESILRTMALLSNNPHGLHSNQCVSDPFNNGGPSKLTIDLTNDSQQMNNPEPKISSKKKAKKKNKQATNQTESSNLHVNHQRDVNQTLIQPGSATNDRLKISKPQIVIAGDSMIKDLRGYRMSKAANVKVYPFTGSTTGDLVDHIKPLLRRKPPMDKLILHIGTNSLIEHTGKPIAAADEIVDLVRDISVNHPNIDIAVSSIVSRADHQVLNAMIPTVNKTLQKFCRQNGWAFIDNSSLNSEHLNGSKLHLNKSGTALLAKHFISFLRGEN